MSAPESFRAKFRSCTRVGVDERDRQTETSIKEYAKEICQNVERSAKYYLNSEFRGDLSYISPLWQSAVVDFVRAKFHDCDVRDDIDESKQKNQAPSVYVSWK